MIWWSKLVVAVLPRAVEAGKFGIRFELWYREHAQRVEEAAALKAANDAQDAVDFAADYDVPPRKSPVVFREAPPQKGTR